ncbi:MAG: tyrosine-type recombinase/integrase [Pirellulaceae bacterium]
MATLRQRNDTFHVLFRYDGQQFQRSLNTRNEDDARFVLHGVERILYQLRTGQVEVPMDVDLGEYILSGGARRTPMRSTDGLTLAQATTQYLESRQGKIADTYLASQRTHLRHLRRYLGQKIRCATITSHRLEAYLEHRLKIRKANTVTRERNTLQRFFSWCQARGHLRKSPAAGLEPVVGGEDLPAYRTMTEIRELVKRGGLSDEEVRRLWKTVFLDPQEIGALLRLVRRRARCDVGYLLHAIPALTGMRRGEILKLTWADVDFAGEQITARSRKQSRRQRESARQIDMHPMLQRELLAWRKRRRTGQFVVSAPESLEPLSPNQANRRFRQPLRGTKWCLDKAKGWYKISFHTYRHSFASNLAAEGVDQRVIDEFMGHQTDAMRKRYRHLFPNRRRDAIARLNLVGGRTAR